MTVSEDFTNSADAQKMPEDIKAFSKGGWNWGWGIATVYTVFALATIAWAVFSFSQKVELVSTDYYAKEISYDDHLARLKNTQALEGVVTGTYDATQQNFRLQFPISVSKGTVLFYRPSSSTLDKSVELKCSATNEMIVSTQGMQSGVWRVQVEWESNGRLYYNEFNQSF